MTAKEVVIIPMTEDFMLWRCNHFEPLSKENLDHWSSDSELSFENYRKRNIPLLEKLIRTYGTCAFIAWDKNQVVGQLRFYPKAVLGMQDEDGFCLQQDYPAGPTDDFADKEFPPLDQLKDKTLAVHCFMAGSSLQKENPYQRKGIGTRLAKTLIQWAKERSWEHIEADAFEDIPHIYEITGCAGISFWERLGFYIAERGPHPHLEGHDEFVITLEEQAKAAGISPERAKDRIIMRLDL